MAAKKPQESVIGELNELFQLIKNLNVPETVQAVKDFVQMVKDMKGMMFEIRELLNSAKNEPPTV